jgi:hypothetical protein
MPLRNIFSLVQVRWAITCLKCCRTAPYLLTKWTNTNVPFQCYKAYWPHEYTHHYIHRAGWRSGNVLDSCSGSARFTSHIWWFSSDAGIVPRLGNDYFQILSKSWFIYHQSIRDYIVQLLKASFNKPQINNITFRPLSLIVKQKSQYRKFEEDNHKLHSIYKALPRMADKM